MIRLKNIKLILTKIKNNPYITHVFAIVGGITYTIQSIYYANFLPSILDEGNYLYKGYLFASGQYVPYEDYGLWTNHMPFAFLIPGWVQVWFGPGLRTGRYFAVLLGILGLLGLWLLVRRLSGKWLAVGAVWIFALNPYVIQTYSVGVSQGLTAFLLIWVLFLTLGEDRAMWQIALGTALGTILLLTRINMGPVILLLIPYIFWQNGRKVGMGAAIISACILLVVHAYFWPGIMRFWISTIPTKKLIHSLLLEISPNNIYAIRDLGQSYWSPTLTVKSRYLSFWQGVQTNFIPLLGVLLTWVTWQKRKLWKNTNNYRVAVFISALFASLFVLHFWSSILRNYCVYCFQGYLTFFDVLGVILISVAWSNLRKQLSKYRHILVVILVLISFMGVAYIARENLPWHYIKPSIVVIWNAFENYHNTDFDLVELQLIMLFSVFTGMIIALLVLNTPKLLEKLFHQFRITLQKDKRPNIIIVFLIVAIILSPTKILGGNNPTSGCNDNVIDLHEAVGAILASNIPAGSQVYWAGGNSPAPLLYLPERDIFPGQLNSAYSLRIGGNMDHLLLLGYRNEELQIKWLQEADYSLIVDRQYFQEIYDQSDWKEIAVTPPTQPCTPGSAIHILQRLP